MLRTAFMGNTTDVQGSAIGLQAHPTNGAPTLTLQNAQLHDNGDLATANVVRVQGGLFLGQHVTSADNLGVPFRFDSAAAGSVLQRSIVWDLVPKHIDAALNLDATCTMYRSAPTGGGTISGAAPPGLDPLFQATARGDYDLVKGISIHAVDKCVSAIPLDLDGYVRDLVLKDRGAFEAP